jgi:Ca2+-binding EF-hand superfamily protein
VFSVLLTQLKLFDANNDGKLSLNEMARLLPIKENALQDTIQNSLMKGTYKIELGDVEKIFQSYDKVRSYYHLINEFMFFLGQQWKY